MNIKLFLVYSILIGDFIRDSQSFVAGMPTGDPDLQSESKRGSKAPDLPRHLTTMESTAAISAKRKDLATSDETSPIRRFFTRSGRRNLGTILSALAFDARLWPLRGHTSFVKCFAVIIVDVLRSRLSRSRSPHSFGPLPCGDFE